MWFYLKSFIDFSLIIFSCYYRTCSDSSHSHVWIITSEDAQMVIINMQILFNKKINVDSHCLQNTGTQEDKHFSDMFVPLQVFQLTPKIKIAQISDGLSKCPHVKQGSRLCCVQSWERAEGYCPFKMNIFSRCNPGLWKQKPTQMSETVYR